jgi:hypothetical protein
MDFPCVNFLESGFPRRRIGSCSGARRTTVLETIDSRVRNRKCTDLWGCGPSSVLPWQQAATQTEGYAALNGTADKQESHRSVASTTTRAAFLVGQRNRRSTAVTCRSESRHDTYGIPRGPSPGAKSRSEGKRTSSGRRSLLAYFPPLLRSFQSKLKVSLAV